MSWHGPAWIAGTAVRLHGTGRWEPVDGRFHWAARVEPEPRIVRLLRSGRRDVEVRVGDRSALARLTEVDPWGGVRITGVGEPPWHRNPATLAGHPPSTCRSSHPAARWSGSPDAGQ